MAEPHWSEVSQYSTKFWQAAAEVGLPGKAALEALGVTTIQDLPSEWGEVTEALQAAAGTGSSPAPAPELAPVEEQVLAPEPAEGPKERNGRSEAGQTRARERLLEGCQSLPEAPAGAFTDVQTKRGFVWGIYVRAGLMPEDGLEAMKSIIEQIGFFEQVAGRQGWEPVIPTNKVPVLPRTGPDQAPARQAQAPRQERPSGPVGGKRNGDYPEHEKVGVGKLTEITCRDGKFQFTAGGLQHPLGDNRGVVVVSGLFSDSCWTERFTEESLEGTAILKPDTFGSLYVRYGKGIEKGFWDVLEIFTK